MPFYVIIRALPTAQHMDSKWYSSCFVTNEWVCLRRTWCQQTKVVQATWIQLICPAFLKLTTSFIPGNIKLRQLPSALTHMPDYRHIMCRWSENTSGKPFSVPHWLNVSCRIPSHTRWSLLLFINVSSLEMLTFLWRLTHCNRQQRVIS